MESTTEFYLRTTIYRLVQKKLKTHFLRKSYSLWIFLDVLAHRCHIGNIDDEDDDDDDYDDDDQYSPLYNYYRMLKHAMDRRL